MAENLLLKVDKLMDLLNDVEQSIVSNPGLLSSEDTKKLTDRFYRFLNVIDKDSLEELLVEREDKEKKDYGKELKDEEEEINGGGFSKVEPSDSPAEIDEEAEGHKAVGGVTPTPPSATPLSASASKSAPISMFQRFSKPQSEALDQPARKRIHESEMLVKKLEKRPAFSCGISYMGDEKEKEYSDRFKLALKQQLPALKTHRHMFRYMAWATVERSDCPHCRQCTNDPPEQQ